MFQASLEHHSTSYSETLIRRRAKELAKYDFFQCSTIFETNNVARYTEFVVYCCFDLSNYLFFITGLGESSF